MSSSTVGEEDDDEAEEEDEEVEAAAVVDVLFLPPPRVLIIIFIFIFIFTGACVDRDPRRRSVFVFPPWRTERQEAQATTSPLLLVGFTGARARVMLIAAVQLRDVVIAVVVRALDARAIILRYISHGI